MNVKPILDAMSDEIKQNLTDFCKKYPSERLTPALVEKMVRCISCALAAAGVTGLRTFLQQFESKAETIVHEGKTMRFKKISEKNFMTPFGKMTLSRNLYQADRGGKTHFPLDAAWEMEEQFATIEVREAVLYMSGLVPSLEAETMLKKCALFQPSSTAIKRIVNKMGQWTEEHTDEVRERVRSRTVVPGNTKVLAASIDGANVLLRESGGKRGRPGERPGKQDITSQRTAYKNAMVGSITCYDDVPEGQKSPLRLSSCYLARMPEDRALTFKSAFESELEIIESALPGNVIKVLVCDAARGIWNYFDKNKRFDGYEKITDFFHVLEHLSLLSESIFGKQSDAGKKWYNKYQEKLLRDDLAPQAILRSVSYYLKSNKISEGRRKDIIRERTFFRNNKH